MSKKGPSFEREFAAKLSLWWSEGKSDSVFWRTQNSGGRATTRAKSGRATKGQYGDIGAVEPEGDDLLKVFTIECKRGYGDNTIINLMDSSPHAAEQEYSKWLNKVIRDSKRAETPYWMLVTKRDKRIPLVFFPWVFVEKLAENGNDRLRKSGKRYASFHFSIEVEEATIKLYVSMVPLERFFRCVKPEEVRRLI